MGGERTYQQWLRLLPTSVRSDAEAELVATFVAEHARAHDRGRLALAAFWIRMATDVVWTAIAERFVGVARLARGFRQVPGDLRPAARRLARTPGWTLTAALTLGVGLAAAIVGFVVIRDVLVRPLPFPDSDRLVRIIEVSTNGSRWWPSFPNATDWRARGRMFSGVAIGDVPSVEPVWIGDRAVRVPVTQAAAGFFETLRVTPLRGRWFNADENRRGGAPAAVVSEAFWRGELASRTLESLQLTFGRDTMPVVGVLPASFRFLGEGAAWGQAADVWLPMDRAADRLGSRSSHGYHVVARLADGMTIDRARTEMNQLAATIKTEVHEPDQADAVRLTPFKDVVTGSARTSLPWLMYAAIVVLVVSCLNLASVLLAQGLARARELAVRLALGATRIDVARQLLVEAMLVAAPGVLFGLLLASGLLNAIRATGETSLPRLDEVGIDPTAAAIAAGVAFAAAGLAGVVPALSLSRSSAVDELRSRGNVGTAKQRRVWSTFVAAQIALTVLLACATGLLTRSLVKALSVDLGYDARGVLAVDITLPPASYADLARMAAFYDSALERLRATPGVSAVGLTSVLPEDTTAYTAQTQRHDHPAATFSGYRVVDPGYFDALGIPWREGDRQAFSHGGSAVDQRLASVLWAGGTPVGDRVDNSFSTATLDVSNVVGTIREWNQEGDDVPGAVYVDFHRRPLSTMHAVVRSSVALPAMTVTIRQVLASIDPRVPVTIDSLGTRSRAGLGSRKLLLTMSVGFGGVALFLAAAGVYSLVAFLAERGRRDTAICLALGARPASLRRQTTVRGAMPALVGVAIGLAAAVPVGRALRAQLFNAPAFDPVVLATAAVTVVAAAWIAASVPARRTTRVDPAAVLRGE